MWNPYSRRLSPSDEMRLSVVHYQDNDLVLKLAGVQPLAAGRLKPVLQPEFNLTTHTCSNAGSDSGRSKRIFRQPATNASKIIQIQPNCSMIQGAAAQHGYRFFSMIHGQNHFASNDLPVEYFQSGPHASHIFWLSSPDAEFESADLWRALPNDFAFMQGSRACRPPVRPHTTNANCKNQLTFGLQMRHEVSIEVTSHDRIKPQKLWIIKDHDFRSMR